MVTNSVYKLNRIIVQESLDKVIRILLKKFPQKIILSVI